MGFFGKPLNRTRWVAFAFVGRIFDILMDFGYNQAGD
jgi:hypothetical protein